MNLISSFAFLKYRTTPKQVISTKWEERTSILENEVNLFCWKRPEEPSISKFLHNLLQKNVTPISFHSHINELEEKLEEAKSTWLQNRSEASNLFWSDVYKLVKDFLSLSEHHSGTVHLKVIDNNACTKFHLDGYVMRLFTTYIGKGTEWLPEEATNRRGLGKQNELIVKDPSKVQQMDPFEVGILKGEVPHHFQSTKGIVHRSPEILSTGEKRIILRVDI